MARRSTVERAANLLIIAAKNANALLFATGFSLAYAGVAVQWSTALANVAAGVLLMALAAAPYLRSRAS